MPKNTIDSIKTIKTPARDTKTQLRAITATRTEMTHPRTRSLCSRHSWLSVPRLYLVPQPWSRLPDA